MNHTLPAAVEQKRLEDLRSYTVLDSQRELIFDEVTKLAALICDVKISFLSFIDEHRQWFKSRIGFELTEIPRDQSYCRHTISGDDLVIVEDAESDTRFRHHPLYLNEIKARFYAGVPLRSTSGSSIGTLCVIDETPRALSEVQKEGLRSLGKHVMQLLEFKIRTEEQQKHVARQSVLSNLAVDAVITLNPPEWTFSSANSATLKLFGASSLDEFCSLNLESVSPKYQPDGALSGEKAKQMIELAIENGSHFFDWMGLKLDGTPMECTIQLSKITEAGGSYVLATVRDVSKEKELEKQLIEAQSISKVGSWSYNTVSHDQTWSIELYKIFEIDYPQPQEKLYQLYRERIHPDDIAVLDRCIERAISFGEDYVIYHRIILDNGKRIKYVQGIGKTTRDASGSVSFLTGTCRDRTAEAEAEIKSQKILESMGEGLVVQNWDGKINQFNPAALEILEMTEDQILGKSSTDPSWKAIKQNGEPFKGEDHPAMITLRTGKPMSNVIMGLRFDQEKLKWLRINSIPFQESAKTSVLTTFSDITELIATKEEIRFVLETVMMGIWKYNPQTRELFWDRSMYSLYEIEPEKFSGHYEAWESCLTDQAKTAAIEALEKALVGEKELDITFEIKAKSKTRFIGAKAKVTRNEAGAPVMMYGINWDRTKEYELEKKLELERAKSIHSARLATIGELAAGVGHEINNPLAIISGHINISRDMLKDPVPNLAEIQDRLRKMDNAVNRITEIVKSLRTFARSDDVKLTHFDLNLLTHETVQSLNELFQKDEVRLSFSGVKKTVLIQGNRGRIQQMLVNLIVNAKDASIGKQHRRVDVEVSFDADDVIVAIKDNGSGIADDLKDKIFDPFFTTKGAHRGTGIGLSLVSTIINEHHGKLDFVTKVGEGTSFRVTLPLVTDEKCQTRTDLEASKTESSALIDCRVLIVDDEQDLLDLFHPILSKMCTSVVTARTALTGYEIIKKGGIDLVLSDIRMPEVDGFSFLRLVTENKEIKPPRFMFLTGGIQMTDAELRILNESTDGFFTKPLNIAEIFKKIKQLFPN